MFYTQFSVLDDAKCAKIKNYLVNLPPNSRTTITLSKISKATDISVEELGHYIDVLVDNHVLKPHFGIKCPDCEMIYEDFADYSDIDLNEKYYCHYCNENKKVTVDDIVVLFTFRNPEDFFGLGQCNNVIKNAAALRLEPEDYIIGASAICNSLNKITSTMIELHNQETEEKREEKRQENKNNKIKALCKLTYIVIASCILGMMVFYIDDFELWGVRVEFIMFVISFIGQDALDYILEKLL